MFRQFKKNVSACRRKLCPKVELDDDVYDRDDKDLIVAYSNVFVMIWTFVQVSVFLFFLILFLNSPKNEFMQTEDSCEALEPIYQENGLPLEACSQNACQMYSFTWNGGWGFRDDRPRKPQNGETSSLFEYDGKTVELYLLPLFL